MAADITFFFFFSLSSLLTRTLSEICPPSSCSDYPHAPRIRFPFYLKNHQNQSCGYNASFELSCSTNNETILNLPNLGGGGEFIVEDIVYRSQILQLRDASGCYSRRLLNSSFNHEFSPFRALGTKNLTFLNCTGEIVVPAAGETEVYYWPVSCLSDLNLNYKVLAVEEGGYKGSWGGCKKIGTVAAPVSRPTSFESELYDGIWLQWDDPNCGACVASKSTGLPRTAKYGIIIGIGIPGFLCLIGLGCFICGKINYYVQCRRRQHNAESAVFSFPIRLQPFEVEMGLDRPTIESYPKTKLGQSGRLPKTDDTTCSICLTDYEPEETLRTIPECGHYFHIECIDEWLKMRGTCPLCRNSPEGSIFTATFLSPTSSSPLSVSSASIEHSGRR